MFTSFQPNGRTVIDYALISRSDLQLVEQFAVDVQASFSDHSVLNVRLLTAARRPPRTSVPRKMHPAQEFTFTDADEIDAMLTELCNSKRTWEEAMQDMFGLPLRDGGNPVHVHTDGSSINNGLPNAAAGAGVYWGPGHAMNTCARLFGPVQTNNRAELLAVLIAVDTAEPDRTLVVHSDSEYAIRSIAEWAPARAELGWKCVNADLIRTVTESIARRAAPIHFNWVPGHKGNKGNEAADGLARDGAALPMPDADYDSQSHRVPPPEGGYGTQTVPVPKVSMSLARSSGVTQKKHEAMFAQEPDLRNEPWFKLSNGKWTQNPALWHERCRSGHRDRANLFSQKQANLERLLAAESRREFWKVINEWCRPSRVHADLDNDLLFDVFEARLQQPREPPPQFDIPLRCHAETLLNSLPQSFADESVDGIFTSEITAENVAAAKVKVMSHLQTQRGVDKFSYGEILSIPNEKLAAFFTTCIRERRIPSMWKLTLLVAVPKAKGPFDNPENYRMIALECCLLKLLTLIIDSRIRTFAEREGLIPNSQNGFRPGYRTENNAFILRIAAEKAHRLQRPLFVTFVDLSNAFPSVNHSILWLKFIHSKITGPIIDWLRTLYSDMRYRIRHEGLMSDEMVAELGVMMGDPGSPLAFLLYIADFRTRNHADDVLLADTVIDHLEHADDIALCSSSAEGLQVKLNDLALWASQNQMKVNLAKTVVMILRRPRTRTQGDYAFSLYGQPLRIVTEQPYVGIRFSSAPGNMWDAHFETCALRARRAANVSFFVESHTGAIPPWEGRQLYTSHVDPHLIWGCEVTGVGTTAQLSQLEDVQHTFLRRLLRLQTRSQLCILFTETGLWPLQFRRLALQLRYLHYLLTLPQSHLASVALRETIAAARAAPTGWFSDLRNACQKVGLDLPETPSTDSVASIEPHLKTALYQHLKKLVDESPKLELLHQRTCYTGKTRRAAAVLEFRDYLRVRCREHRQALTSLVVSDHCLAIEQLRRGTRTRTEKVPRALRLCRFCMSEIEDPLHALFTCTASEELVELRLSFWEKYKQSMPRNLENTDVFSVRELQDMQPKERLHALLSSVESASILGIFAARMLSLFRLTPLYEPSDEDITAYREAERG